MSAVVALDAMLAARTLWHAGRSAAIASDGEPTGHAALDALLPQGGWPRRALTELLLPAGGVGELSLLLPTLARCTREGARVAVIAPPYLPYAPAWQAAGVDLSQLRIIEAAPRDALWAFEQCLRSGACAAVLAWPQQADARALRRLQVAADSGQCLGFALRDSRHAANPSPAALRLEAVREMRGIGWQVRKCRGGPAPAAAFVLEPTRAGMAATSVPVAQLPSARVDRDAAARVFDAPPSAFGTFSREQGKARPVPGISGSPSPASKGSPSPTSMGSPAPLSGRSPPLGSGGRGRPVCAPPPSGPTECPARYAGPDGRGWGPNGRDAAIRAAPPSATSASARVDAARTFSGPQHELPFVPSPASLARD